MLFLILLSGCKKFSNTEHHIKTRYFVDKQAIENSICRWYKLIKAASCQYNVDAKLIKAIIYAESSGNPYAKSRSNAVGLMQIKPSTSGLEVYRLHGRSGQPSVQILYNPQKNIDIGTNYIKFLQKKNLYGIKNRETMKYATIVSYVNGASALLKIFAKNKKSAISMINSMSTQMFLKYVKKNIQQNKQCNI